MRISIAAGLPPAACERPPLPAHKRLPYARVARGARRRRPGFGHRLPAALACALLIASSPLGAATEAERDAIRRLLASGEPAQALDRADRGLAGDPRDVTVAFLRGVALMDLGRDAEALAQFERMSQEHPQLPDPLNNVALLQARAGRLEAAREALETALRNDPSHRTARANLGLVHLMLAARAWEPLAASGPLDPTLARRLQAVRALLAEGGR